MFSFLLVFYSYVCVCWFKNMLPCFRQVSGSFTKWRNVARSSKGQAARRHQHDVRAEAMKCVDEEDFQEWSTTFRPVSDFGGCESCG